MPNFRNVLACYLTLVCVCVSLSRSDATTNEEQRRNLQEDLQTGISSYFKLIINDVTVPIISTPVQIQSVSSSSSSGSSVEFTPMDLKSMEISSKYMDTDLGDKNLVWSLRGSHTSGTSDLYEIINSATTYANNT